MLETVKKCSYLVSQLWLSAVVTDYGQLITGVYIHQPLIWFTFLVLFLPLVSVSVKPTVHQSATVCH